MALEDASTIGPAEAALLQRFGATPEALLGAGGESRVFAVDQRTVLRIFHPSPVGRDRAVADLLARWRGIELGFQLPDVLDQGREANQSWTLEHRIPGTSLADVLPTATPLERRQVLREVLVAVGRLQELPLPADHPGGHGRILAPDRAGFASLHELLEHQMDLGVALGGNRLAELVDGYPAQRAALSEQLRRRRVEPAFVHGDICPGNVMVHQGRVSGIIDLSVHALAADPVLDLVAVGCFLDGYPDAPADAAWLDSLLCEQLGAEAWLVDAYRRFYACYYSMDPAIHAWCAAQFSQSAATPRRVPK